MPSYTNPYFGPTYYPASYAVGQASFTPYNNMPAWQPQQQSYTAGPACAMAWVDGEIEARGRQIPQGVTQYAMWDTNRQVIYLKSLNQMGMPNPMQILHYAIDEQQNNLPSGQKGETGSSGNASDTNSVLIPDMSQYVTKRDFDQLRNEIRVMSRNLGAASSNTVSGTSSGNINVNTNQNGSNNSGNRGGNR